jgi:hypothetical protein
VGVEDTSPVEPVGPEAPDVANGLDTAWENAGPVSPVLVDDEPAWASPELPDTATGLDSTEELPPEPPPDSPVPTLDPPEPPLEVWAKAGRDKRKRVRMAAAEAAATLRTRTPEAM